MCDVREQLRGSVANPDDAPARRLHHPLRDGVGVDRRVDAESPEGTPCCLAFATDGAGPTGTGGVHA